MHTTTDSYTMNGGSERPISNGMNSDTIHYLANLARLTLSPEEVELFATDLQSIIGFIDEIQGVQLSDTIKTNEGMLNVFREDTVVPLNSTYNLTDAAPFHEITL